jgi:hypothetical protein
MALRSPLRDESGNPFAVKHALGGHGDFPRTNGAKPGRNLEAATRRKHRDHVVDPDSLDKLEAG